MEHGLTNQVSFAYPSRSDRLALDNATFFFPSGETTFVIGTSGSGKSTLSNLLLKFYSSASGEILLDSRQIESLNTDWLRNNITLVQQDNILFNETIFRNISLGRYDQGSVEKNDVKTCLDFADLRETILELPEGLDTFVGAGGKAISGGQRQRLAIARARLRNTPILVLDEATSALDQSSKSRVVNALREWRAHKTTIIITHDVSQILPSNYVYVLENGRVVQDGYRDALEFSASSPYNRIFGHRLGKNIKEEDSNDEAPDSRASSIYSQDSLDVQVSRRRTLVPKAYRPTGADEVQDSDHLQKTLAPVAAHLHRMNTTRMSMRPLRRYGKDLSIAPRPPPQEGLATINDKGEREVGQPSRVQSVATSLQDLGKRVSTRMSLRDPQPNSVRTDDAESGVLLVEQDVPRTFGTPALTLRQILRTVWPHLVWAEKLTLLAGFAFAFVHAAATPVFSWVFSKLLGTFFGPTEDRARLAMMWSLTVLGVAVVDAIASFFMHFLLEKCGQAWVDSLRMAAMQRLLDQPRPFFDDEEHGSQKLSECLDRNGEEMRNLVGRFAGFVFVAFIMVTVAIAWSAVLSWKLTLVGLATGPFLYAISRGFEGMSSRWEQKCNDAAQAASSVFTETFTNIRTIRALTLEGYFHQKFAKATASALRTGLQRGFYSGIFFGLTDGCVPSVIGTPSCLSSEVKLTRPSIGVLVWLCPRGRPPVRRPNYSHGVFDAAVLNHKCHLSDILQYVPKCTNVALANARSPTSQLLTRHGLAPSPSRHASPRPIS